VVQVCFRDASVARIRLFIADDVCVPALLSE
jgi:hypothetical protein